MSGAAFNLGIVILTPLLARRMGIYVLPLGIIAGSLGPACSSAVGGCGTSASG